MVSAKQAKESDDSTARHCSILKQFGKISKYRGGDTLTTDKFSAGKWKNKTQNQSQSQIILSQDFLRSGSNSQHVHSLVSAGNLSWTMVPHIQSEKIPNVHFSSGAHFMCCSWQLLCTPLRQICHYKAFMFVIRMST